jgi:hypothetical protein
MKKLVLLILIPFLSFGFISANIEKELLYDIVWGTIYNAEHSQCDDSPNITADGTVIDPTKASEYRYLAISQDMLFDLYRQSLVKDTTRFRGKLKFGDDIWIESDYPALNGKWTIHDAMNKRHIKAVDFLQTKGDGKLYKNDKLFPGKFHNIKIYSYNERPNNPKTFINMMILPLTSTVLLKSINLVSKDTNDNKLKKVNNIYDIAILKYIVEEKKKRILQYKKEILILQKEIISIEMEIHNKKNKNNLSGKNLKYNYDRLGK